MCLIVMCFNFARVTCSYSSPSRTTTRLIECGSPADGGARFAALSLLAALFSLGFLPARFVFSAGAGVSALEEVVVGGNIIVVVGMGVVRGAAVVGDLTFLTGVFHFDLCGALGRWI